MGPTSGAYTLNQDIYVSTLTVNSGITLNTAGNRIFCQGTVTNNGTIKGVGASASEATGGTNITNYAIGGSNTAGGNGATGNGAAGTGTATAYASNGGQGGNGSSGTGGILYKSAGPNGSLVVPHVLLSGVVWSYGSAYQIGTGLPGGGGGGDGTNAGGGGGAGGHLILIIANALVNNGVIQSVGGNGAPGTGGNSGGGGGGSAGAVIIYTKSAVSGTGSMASTPGTPGAGVGTGTAGGLANNNQIGVLEVVLS